MKRHAPATLRNRDAIVEVLAKELPASGTVLEVASGSGEHAVYFAQCFPQLKWQPSDPDPEAVASIAAYREEAQLGNLLAPIALDAMEKDWPEVEPSAVELSAIVCINMTHISPWEASVGLFEGAARQLEAGASLLLYGPYFEEDVEPAPSNLAFDQSLKARNSNWGIRQLAEVDTLAQDCGFARSARYEMPANNLTLVYRRI